MNYLEGYCNDRYINPIYGWIVQKIQIKKVVGLPWTLGALFICLIWLLQYLTINRSNGRVQPYMLLLSELIGHSNSQKGLMVNIVYSYILSAEVSIDSRGLDWAEPFS